MKTILVLIPLLLSTAAFAAKKTDGQFEIKNDVSEITITTKKGFHLNDKAPASVVFDDTEAKLKPVTKTEKKFVFKILEKAKKAKLDFYICDDAKTVCESQSQVVALNGKTTSLEAQDSRAVAAELASNKKYDKITLLDFNAPWCPACIRLKSETMNTPAVKAVLAKVNFKDVNIDLVENEKLADQYGVKAIPTVVLVNENGEEIRRWLDYQPRASFVAELKTSLKDTETISKLIDKANAGDKKAATELGYNSYNRMQWKDAVKWFSFSHDPKELNYKLAAEISLTEDGADDSDATKAAYLKALEKGFTLTTSKLDQMRWKLDYLDQLKQQNKQIDSDAVMSLQNELATVKDKDLKTLFAQSTVGDNENFEKAELLDMQQRLYKVGNDDNNAKLTQAALEKSVDAVKLSIKKPGQMINAIWYYGQAEAAAKAEPLLKKLIAANPKSYVYYQKYATFLTKHKRNDEALKQMDLALQYKEGNEPQLNLAKVKILKELGKKDEAVSLIDTTLKLTQAYPEKYKHTQTALEDLKKTLTK